MADRYVITNGGDWHDASTWSETSGGVGGAGVPTWQDNVFLDNNSGDLTIDTSTSTNCSNFEVSSDYTGALVGLGTGEMTVLGNRLTIPTGTTVTGYWTISVNTAPSTDSNDPVIINVPYFSGDIQVMAMGASPVVLGDELQVPSGEFEVNTSSSGSFSSDGYNITANMLTLSTQGGSCSFNQSTIHCKAVTMYNTSVLITAPDNLVVSSIVGGPLHDEIQLGPHHWNRVEIQGGVASNPRILRVADGNIIDELVLTDTVTLLTSFPEIYNIGTLQVSGGIFAAKYEDVGAAINSSITLIRNCYIQGIHATDPMIVYNCVDAGHNVDVTFATGYAPQELTHTMVGTVYDGGQPVEACDAYLLKFSSSGAEVVSYGITDETGVVNLGAPDGDPSYGIVYRKGDKSDVTGDTDLSPVEL